MDKGHWLYQPQDTWTEENESGQDTTEKQQAEARIKSACAAASIINNIKKEVKEEDETGVTKQ